EIAIEHDRVDVAFAANGRGIAETAGHARDRRAQVSLCLRDAGAALELLERERGHDGPRPGPEILGGDVLAGDLLQVGAHVARGDVLQLAVLIEVLEQLLAGQFLAGADDLGDTAIRYGERPLLAALADESEADLRPVDGDVAALQRGQAVAAVLLG